VTEHITPFRRPFTAGYAHAFVVIIRKGMQVAVSPKGVAVSVVGFHEQAACSHRSRVVHGATVLPETHCTEIYDQDGQRRCVCAGFHCSTS
jgi:hypothetical protein